MANNKYYAVICNRNKRLAVDSDKRMPIFFYRKDADSCCRTHRNCCVVVLNAEQLNHFILNKPLIRGKVR
jgi:hypothetical protein